MNLTDSHLVRVAQGAGEPAPAGYRQFAFDAFDAGASVSNGETDTSVKQRVIVRIIAEIPTEHVGVKSQTP